MPRLLKCCCYPPCRRFRSFQPRDIRSSHSYPPCRRFRRNFVRFRNSNDCYPPCRRFRSDISGHRERIGRYPPCRRFRRVRTVQHGATICYPPCRRFRRKQDIWVCRSCSSRPFFEKFRHFATGTLAFEPIHDLGKLAAVEDDGKAPGSGVDTLPRL